MKKLSALVASVALFAPLLIAPSASALTKSDEVRDEYILHRSTSAQGSNIAVYHHIAANPEQKKGYANTFLPYPGSGLRAGALVGHNLDSITKWADRAKGVVYVGKGRQIPITIIVVNHKKEWCTVEIWAQPHPNVK